MLNTNSTASAIAHSWRQRKCRAKIKGKGVEQAEKRGHQLDCGKDSREPGKLPGEKEDQAVRGGITRPIGMERGAQPLQVGETGEGLPRLLGGQFHPGKDLKRIPENVLRLPPVGPGPALVQQDQETNHTEPEQENCDLVLSGRGRAHAHF
ncbi:MAG: hypothetical protein IPN11_12120 [Opitutaceae bacterium]|nr:hypothetical protein [Opitutaceae bacterium]